MRSSTKLGIATLVAMSTLGLVGLSSQRGKPSDLEMFPSTKKEHTQNTNKPRNAVTIKSSPYTESKNFQEKPQDIYKGPQSLLQFLNNQTYGFNDPNTFFRTSETQITDFQKVQKDMYTWAKEQGYKATLSEDQKGNQENNGWPTGVISLNLGKGITYNTRILNSQISTTINSPERKHSIVSNLSPSRKIPNSYNFRITDNKRKEAIKNGESFPDPWCELYFDYNTERVTENQTRIFSSKGYWNDDLKGIVHKKEEDTIISIPQVRYSRLIQEQKDLNKFFKSNFPNTTKYLK